MYRYNILQKAYYLLASSWWFCFVMKNTVQKVHLIQYNDWPADSNLPSSAASFVRLHDRVNLHRRDNEDQRIAVVDK